MSVENGIFGGSKRCFKTYGLIVVSDEKVNECKELLAHENAGLISLNDGTGFSLLYDVEPKQIIALASRFNVIDFIIGSDCAPSTPYYYRKNKNGFFEAAELETVGDMDDLELIAKGCGENWEELSFNDYFRECLYTCWEEFEKYK